LHSPEHPPEQDPWHCPEQEKHIPVQELVQSEPVLS
jgi:hypothetical protein